MGKGKNGGGKNQNANQEENARGKAEAERKNEKQIKKITEAVYKVYMHCEGCKAKVSKYFKRFDGVEEVTADVENDKVVIKGKDINPMKVLEEIRRKYSKNVELIFPLPKSLLQSTNHGISEPKKEEIQVKTVELKMQMHCEGCVKDIKKAIEKMEGVFRVEPNKESSTVIVKGAVDPPKLVEAIKTRLGKSVEMVKLKKHEKQSQSSNGDNKARKKLDGEEDGNFVFKYPPQYSMTHIYPNQTFSDDNVFSCAIM